MPQYSNRVQWEDDWNFVHRSLEEAGVFGRFEQAKNGKSHTLVLMADVYFVPQLEPKTVRFMRTGLREEVDGFTQWKEQQQIQSARLTTRTGVRARIGFLRRDRARRCATHPSGPGASGRAAAA